MKVGTDGVLLGGWAPVSGARILDLGTGTGLLALMAAQRNPQAEIEAVELDPASAAQAAENFAASPWAARLHLHPPGRAQDFFPPHRYDAILCNPPFFVHGRLPQDPRRRAARHSQSFPYPEMATTLSRLLSPAGLASVILPEAESHAFLNLALDQRLFLHHSLRVHPLTDKPPHRRILVLSLQAPVVLRPPQVLTIQEKGARWYTPEFQQQLRDFYLDF